MSFIRITKKQYEGLTTLINEKVDSIANNVNYNLDAMHYYFNPNTPEVIFINFKESGVSGGVPYVNSEYICVDKSGAVDDCGVMFPELKERLAFYSDFKEFYIKNGKATFKK